ncbi:MAG TPA: tetratricopeptide repeat protein [Gammaproteobacteria bacterium]|nr:tetratricopeptide repeat protein [Gammaproteobacteria bacterium]
MPVAVISLAVQILAIVHVLRTGRDWRWVLLILFLPGLGVLVYAAVEVLPSLGGSLTARRAVRRVRAAVDPERDLRRERLEWESNPTVETASRLADELTRAGRPLDAVRICTEARTGLFEDDPKLLLALARAEFAAAEFAAAIRTLDYLREKNPSFRSPEGHLLYARALEQSGATKRALEEYERVAAYFPGPEAKARYALLLKRSGSIERADELFGQILSDARVAPRHFRKSQREWIDLAKREKTAGD